MIENQQLEFKESWRDEYLKYVSGFANAQGGSLLIGVNDKGDVIGINDSKVLLETLPNKIVTLTGVVADVELLDENGREYIKITIAPSITPVTYRGKLYYRSGSTLQELDGMSAQNFLLKKMGISWDAQIIEGATLDDIDPFAIEYFVHEGISKGRLPKQAKTNSISQLLGNLKLMDKQGRLTMAALLLFGKEPQRFCLNARFKIGRFGRSAADLINQDLIEGNLIQMVDRVVDTLSSKYLIRPIHYQGMQRVEPLEIPEKGLREILYNSIIHKSYDGPDIQMKIYDDRISLWNYGQMPEGTTISEMFQEHRSIPRNKLIANAFFYAGFVEAWGRGFEIITESFKANELEIPTFKEEFNGVNVNIKREIFSAIQRGARVDDRSGKVFYDKRDVTKDVTKELTERQRFILQLIQTDRHISINELSQKTGVVSRTVIRDLSYLQKYSFIIREGGRKEGHWIILP